MADIRINSLPSTATSFNSDDYIAIDGTSGGTRKMLAANPPFNDVILGTSGPSVKSTLSARAPRQGLVFDGTAIANNANVPAFGSADFTFAAWVYQPTLAAAYLCSSVGGADDTFMYLTGSGTFQWWSNSVARATSSAGAVQAGKWTLLTATRTGGTTTLYANGVSVGSGADTQNITAAIDRIGGRSNSTNILNGALVPLIYNRALSSSEVVALYEAGGPAGSDYNTASNTSVLTGANSDFSSAGNWNVSGSTTISGGKLNLSDGDAAYNGLAQLVAGRRYKLTITVDSVTAGAVQYYNGSSYTTFATTAGTYTIEFAAAATFAPGLHLRSSGGNAVLDTALYYQLGLLLAPDAYQAGGGLNWYDTSGNSATITLPASGVSWNVPSSQKTASGWTFGGNLNVSGTVAPAGVWTGAASIGIDGTDKVTLGYLASTVNGAFVSANNSAASAYAPLNLGGTSVIFRLGTTETARFAATSGNLLLGTTTDSSNGKLQIKGALSIEPSSAGAGNLVLSTPSANTSLIKENAAGHLNFQAYDYDFQKHTGVSILTLDVNKDATFAGAVTATGGYYLNGTAGTNRGFSFYTSSVSRWYLYEDSTAESGSNAGSDIRFARYDDGGGYLAQVFEVKRSTGLFTFNSQVALTASTPASASATGVTGTITWDASYIYVCTATNTWKRVAIATW